VKKHPSIFAAGENEFCVWKYGTEPPCCPKLHGMSLGVQGIATAAAACQQHAGLLKSKA
jgi:hypothetical protein